MKRSLHCYVGVSCLELWQPSCGKRKDRRTGKGWTQYLDLEVLLKQPWKHVPPDFLTSKQFTSLWFQLICYSKSKGNCEKWGWRWERLAEPRLGRIPKGSWGIWRILHRERKFGFTEGKSLLRIPLLVGVRAGICTKIFQDLWGHRRRLFPLMCRTFSFSTCSWLVLAYGLFLSACWMNWDFAKASS